MPQMHIIFISDTLIGRFSMQLRCKINLHPIYIRCPYWTDQTYWSNLLYGYWHHIKWETTEADCKQSSRGNYLRVSYLPVSCTWDTAWDQTSPALTERPDWDPRPLSGLGGDTVSPHRQPDSPPGHWLPVHHVKPPTDSTLLNERPFCPSVLSQNE